MKELDKLKEMSEKMPMYRHTFTTVIARITELEADHDNVVSQSDDLYKRLQEAESKLARREAQLEESVSHQVDLTTALHHRDEYRRQPDIMISKEGAEAIHGIINREMSSASRYVTFHRPSQYQMDGLVPLYIDAPSPELKANPDYVDHLFTSARREAKRAMDKFPQPNYTLLKVAEEAGEVVKGCVHFAEGRETWVKVEGEIIQTIAMLIRLVTEGDEVNGVIPPTVLPKASS